MKLNIAQAEGLLIIGVGIVGAFALYKVWGVASKAAVGVVTGDNALTRNATDASGAPVTAYQGAGIVGTAGAAANAASGGVLSSIGSWIGTHVYDLTHDDPMDRINTPTPGTKDDRASPASEIRYQQTGNAASGSGNTMDIDFGFGDGWGQFVGS